MPVSGGIIPYVDMEKPDALTWDDCFAIAKSLQQAHPDSVLEEISLEGLYQWVIELPDFADDPDMVNESILLAILQEWFEEANPL